MCWALIKEITPCAEEMADENEMACCVRCYHVYKDIWEAAIGKVLVCRCWKNFHFKNYIHVKYFWTFSVHKNIFTMKKSEYSTMCLYMSTQVNTEVCVRFRWTTSLPKTSVAEHTGNQYWNHTNIVGIVLGLYTHTHVSV